MVPEIEEREAAKFNGYTWRTWQDLPRRERVDNVAYFRLSRLIDLHREDAVYKHSNRPGNHS